MAEEMRPLYLIAGTDGAKIDATRTRLRARAEREAGADALEVFEPGEGRGMPDHEALLLAIPAMSLDAVAPLPAGRRGRALARPPGRAGRRRGRRTSPRPDPGPDLPRQNAAEALQSGQSREGGDPRVRGAESARDAAGAGRQRAGARLPARPRRRPSPGRAHGRQLRAAAARAGAAGAVGGGGGRGQRRRPRGDDRRHLRGGRLVALRRPDRTRRRRRPADRRAPDRPGRERHRADLRPRLAPARRLLRRRPARAGHPAQAGRVLAEDAPLRRQAAGRPPARHRTSPTCVWLPRP